MRLAALVAGPGDGPFDAAEPVWSFSSPEKTLPTQGRLPSTSASESARPPGKRSTASAGTSPSFTSDGSQDQRSSTPRNRKALARAMRKIVAALSRAALPKISGSGWKLTLVPRRLGVVPILRTGPLGTPRL